MTSPTSSSPAGPSVPTGNTRSFKDVLLGGSSSSANRVKFVYASFKGCPALLFEDSVVSQLAAPFSFTLVGKFVMRRPNLDIIHKFFYSLNFFGSFNVSLLDPKHIAIQLSNDLDYSRIFSRRSYYIQGCQMRLLKWSPEFDVREESPIAPVWIGFPNLRLHFFSSYILFGMASVFCRPLQTDQAMASLSRPYVARVLVELDVTKKYPHEIWLRSEVNGYFQKIEIENLPIFCFHCKMHGHTINECFRLHPNLHKKKVSSKTNVNGDREDFPKPHNDVGNDSGSLNLVLQEGEHLGVVNLAKEAEVNPITNVSTFSVLNHDNIAIDLIANGNDNIVNDSSSNHVSSFNPIII
ncbi:uncharacterized protein LOC110108388 [Dendrobium catenatum]|uniref:uncharacterized protein LOC110108388 n=1 Tax=Dendrobium catenatum TaxID=906689 RepID=UPI0009F20817|nr:uncharacterized protein LOC110108388 [Dendrobium catenatum]